MEGARAAVLEWCLIAVGVLAAAVGVRSVIVGDTVTSRLATVWSLTHEHTWYIDRPAEQPPNPFEPRTVDKVAVNDRLVSSKPPLLTVLMTAEYVALQSLFGWDLDTASGLKRQLQCMILSLVVFAYAGTLFFFRKTLRLFDVPAPARLFLLAALAFGTQLFGYAPQLNNHVPGVCMAMAAVYLGLGLGSGRLAPRPWRFALFGLSAGLVYTIDLPVTVFPAFAGVYLLWRFPRIALLWGAAGAALPLGIHFGILTWITGSPLPVQTKGGMYLYEASPWRNPLGIDGLNEPKLTYLFHITFGRHGAFVLFPVLLAGIAGTIRALARRDTACRGYILGGALAVLLLTAYYTLHTNNYGGEAYGFRWYIGSMPMLLLMGAPVIGRIHTRWKWAFLLVLLVISVYSAVECARFPWTANQEWTCRYFLGPSC